MRKYFILSLLLLSFYLVHAQAPITTKIIGIVKDSITLIPISGVSIHDINHKTSTYSGENGIFNIMAASGDTVKYSGPSFVDGYTVITEKKFRADTIEIWLRPKIKEELPGVFVSTYTYKEYQSDSAQRLKEFSEEIGFKTPTFSKSSSGAGVGIGLDAIFSKKNKQKKEAYKTFKQEEQDRYIDFRFKPVLVHLYSGLKGRKLQDFMHQYRPSYDWLRDNADGEALKYYINDKLKIYFSRNK